MGAAEEQLHLSMQISLCRQGCPSAGRGAGHLAFDGMAWSSASEPSGSLLPMSVLWHTCSSERTPGACRHSHASDGVLCLHRLHALVPQPMLSAGHLCLSTCAALCQNSLKSSSGRLSRLCVTAGRETLFEEDLEEGEVEAELAPLAAQAAHVAGRAGRVSAAVAAYQVNHNTCRVHMRRLLYKAAALVTRCLSGPGSPLDRLASARSKATAAYQVRCMAFLTLKRRLLPEAPGVGAPWQPTWQAGHGACERQ